MTLKGFLHRSDKSEHRNALALTDRETEIVRALARGMTTKKTAAALGLSARTVETHRSNIMRKLDLHSFSELVLYAARNHIIAIDDEKQAGLRPNRRPTHSVQNLRRQFQQNRVRPKSS
jgi:DNA-binding CsgD family transcriptional regulator